MSIKTIDNLGLDASKRYAQNQKEAELELPFLEEISKFPVSAISTAPYSVTEAEVEAFFIGRPTPWASFTPPPDYAGFLSRLFIQQAIPSFGNLEEQQERLDRFSTLKDQGSWTAPQRHEYDTILSCLEFVVSLEKTYEMIEGRRRQFLAG